MQQTQENTRKNERWQAVLERDAQSDGAFVYGVTTTRIYCRPTCPSRRPKRENARFFETIEAARQAGFRACQRCHPDESKTVALKRVEQACLLIAENLQAPLSLDELAAQIGESTGHLQRSFKEVMGVSPREYGEALRLQIVKTSLQNGDSILGAQSEAGFGSRALYERAPTQLGMTPATYKRGGAGAKIYFSIAPCDLGFLLVAATPQGICSITLGDAPEQLESELRAEFPKAQIGRDDKQLREHLHLLLRHLAGKQPHLDLPFDVQATAFTRRVWQELRAIGYGQTRTYTQIAQALGQPTAVRAVARACATNPVALLVPCHRVVRQSGALAGYRWGIERKKALLEKERQAQKDEGPRGSLK